MNAIHVFSDASGKGRQFAGAYVVGMGGAVAGVRLSCHTSCDAELLACARGVEAAMQLGSESIVIAHIDLDGIYSIIQKKKTAAAVKLAESLELAGAFILPDARQFHDYRRCHRHARLTLGIGRKYELKLKAKELNVRLNNRKKYEAIIDAIRNHPDGVSGWRLSQESGISLGESHKILCHLQGHCKVRCEKPANGVAQCDLRNWKWFFLAPLESYVA